MLSNVVLIKSGTDEKNERANQRMIDCLTEEKKESMSDKHAYLDEDEKHVCGRAFLIFKFIERR